MYEGNASKYTNEISSQSGIRQKSAKYISYQKSGDCIIGKDHGCNFSIPQTLMALGQEAAVAKPLAPSPIRDRRSEALEKWSSTVTGCHPKKKHLKEKM